MTGLRLFLRTRRAVLNVVVIFGAAFLVMMCGPVAVGLVPQESSLTRVAMMVPLIPATVIAASSVSSLPIQEGNGVRNIHRWGLAYVASLTALLVAALCFSGVQLPPPDATTHDQGAVSVVRNGFALVGAALIGYRLLEHRGGWVLGLAWVILPPQVLPRPQNDPVGLFTLITQPDLSANAFVWALGVWVLGVLGVAVRGGPMRLARDGAVSA